MLEGYHLYMMNDENLITILKHASLFKELKEEEIKEIISIARRVNLKKGEVLFKEGDKGNSMYIITKGKVSVIKRGEKLVTLKKGDFFGEMALIEEKPRSADIVAETSTTLLEIDKKSFEKFLMNNPHVTFRMMKILSQRLRETDITLIKNLRKKNIELQKAYDELKRMQEELIKKEKLSAIGMLTARIVHDFKNPIGAIKNCIEFILEDGNPTELTKRMCTYISEATDYMLALVMDLLELSKGNIRISLDVVNIDDLLYRTVDEFEGNLREKGIKKELNLNYKDMIKGDPHKLKRCFSNIIANAIDAMDKGGILYVGTEKENGGVKVLIRDTGKGIPEDIIDRIFEPFFTKGKERGTGLGMAIAKGVIDAHKGKIEVKSEVGKGTEMIIFLPSNPGIKGA